MTPKNTLPPVKNITIKNWNSKIYSLSPLKKVFLIEYLKYDKIVLDVLLKYKVPGGFNSLQLRKRSFKRFSEYAVYMNILLYLIGTKYDNLFSLNYEELTKVENFLKMANFEGYKLLYDFRLYKFKSRAINDFIMYNPLSIESFSYSRDDIILALNLKLSDYQGDIAFFILINIQFLIFVVERIKIERTDLYFEMINSIIHDINQK